MLTAQAVPHSNRELWWSFFAIIGVTLVYLFVVITWNGVPAASGLFGHSIGILGFILMLMTETLYTLRKRSRSTRWGRVSSWLRFHIFTGIVGPYMVLIHTSWKFNGLAGIILLLTVIIVVSGFIGRYVYTSIPRTADGMEVEEEILGAQIAALEAQIGRWEKAASSQAAPEKTGESTRPQPGQLKKFIKRRQALRRQMNSLATTRRLLALWHTVHIPIGMVLFTGAFIHIVAAFYYATLLR
jgi:hypothetical protein